ncbi:hypothetical protein IFM89_036812 [Coptis chinensis]|uniref:Transcription elongation factor spt6 n=1 Tax=Coptis chinensis TaxID=261450 RepID=A0A835HHI8_9MAGN|nr:hypothetical protein IFM89_036812 [Coptis chinensis]
MGLGKTVVSDDEDEINDEEDEIRDGEDVADREDDDEEDEEGQDEYEKDDFIVDDVEEEEEEEEQDDEHGDGEKHKKKKKRKRESEKNYVLDEDDYMLLDENNVGFHRPKPGSKKFKRLKKAGRDNDIGETSGFSDDDVLDERGRTGRTAEQKLKHSLFGDDEGRHLEDIAEEDEQPEEEEDVDLVDEDEMADFIVDEEVDEHGAPVRRKKINRKKSRQAHGVSSSALQEAHDIFGDVDELLALRKQGLQKSGRYNDSGDYGEKRLEDEFEPFVLSEKYMTERDNHIRDVDVPERMQISEESTGPYPTYEMSIEEESVWIHNQLMTNYNSLFVKTSSDEEIPTRLSSDIKEDIPRFLELMHVEKCDIPFIAMYRKESCPTLLKDFSEEVTVTEDRDKDTRKLKWHKVLWAIKDLDKKWLLLQKRKIALQSYYKKRYEEESRRVYDLTRLNLNQKLFESIIESLKTAETEREVDDVDSKFNLHFPPGEVGVDEGQFKRPKRKSHYSICSKAGLWEVSRKIGHSSEQLGLLINLETMNIVPLNDAEKKESPEDLAQNFTCAMFETPQAVLKGARHMAAVEISCEPRIRKHVRGKFMSGAVVSTSPTPDGNAAIDSFHQFAGVKWLRNKPVKEFKDAQWLQIQKAEEEKLLKVTIKLPQEELDRLISEITEYYLSDEVSAAAKIWNEQRSLILKDAFSNFLIPSMEKEVRSVLTARSKNFLLMEYGKQLWSKVSVAPYKRKGTNDVSPDDEAAPRVMACCWGRGNPATTFVMLDSSGEVVDVLEANYISSRSQNVNDEQRKKNDQQRLMKFVTDHGPHVVVLGAVNFICTRLKSDIYEIIWKVVEEHPRDMEDEDVVVHFGDESLPRLYENSRISADQLPGHSGIVKRAVALGRYLQTPLAMVATLCGPGREILSWKLHPFEDFITPDEKYEMVEQVMVDVTNQVGIDINLASSHEWLFSPLQFVSGLGPRKAASLQKALVRNGAITTRKDILGDYIKRKVFVNAIGFLRVRRSGLATNSSQLIDLLDDTRIHPESYELAKHMAKDVFDHEGDQDDSNDEDDAQEMAVEHVRERPNFLRMLDINIYAKSIEERYDVFNKRETLYDIKMELLHGFRDWRVPYVEPNQDEAFYMLTGETKDTIAEGRVVQVTVRKVLPQKAICELESRVTGILTADDYSDMRRPDDLSLELNEGDVLNCMIKNIQTNRHQVYLSYKESEVKGDQYRNTVLDPFYHPDEFLSDKEAGESIIHPSYRGPSCLTLTLKVEDGVYAQKDIAESGKDHKDITSLLRLGKTLKIGDDTFEDLDEVMDRYVDPLVTHLKAMLNYRKFRRGTKAEVDDLLRNEKSENPMRIVYCFGISHEHPGTFILFYIKNTNPHHELISLYPKGFKFRKRTFEEIDRLVAYFQKHIDDLPPDSTQSVRSVAAMVPMRSPAGGGWSGSAANGNDGSWRGHGSSDRERSSTPGSRSVLFPPIEVNILVGSAGAKDYRNGGRDGHPSGAPRPYGGRGGGRDGNRGGGRDGGWDGGRGRGRGRGNNRSSDREDSGFGSSRWNAGPKDDNDGLSSFPGAKTQNSPGREAFPGSWGSGWGSGGDAAGGGNDGWGSGGGKAAGGGSEGWGSGGGTAGGGNDGWGSGGGKAAGGTDGWGSGGGTATAGTDGWGSGGGTPAGGAGGWGSTGGTAGGGSEGWGSGKVNGVTGAGKEWNSSGTKGTAAAQDPGSENAGWGDSSKKNGSAAKEDGNGWGGTGW